MRKTLRIATRQSALALWQANYVKDKLLHFFPELTVDLVTFVTQGDRLIDTPLTKIGGKALFVKELEKAMLTGEADLAVHSIKDMPAELPDGLMLATVCQRADARDALIAKQVMHLSELPAGAVVGTSSLRRQCQLQAQFPQLVFQPLRGNVPTRLEKLQQGQYDAIVLAAAGLQRLGLADHISHMLSVNEVLPAAGQGAIGIECRSDDAELIKLLAPLDHQPTRDCIVAERKMNKRLQGGCEVPIAAYAELQQETLFLRGLVGDPDGQTLLCAEARAPRSGAEDLGLQVADDLLAQGAGDIIKRVYHDE